MVIIGVFIYTFNKILVHNVILTLVINAKILKIRIVDFVINQFLN